MLLATLTGLKTRTLTARAGDTTHGARHSRRPRQAHGSPRTFHGRDAASGVLVIIGDSIHNALDGVLIAAAFLTSFSLGLVTTFAVAAHEIPHRVGDFAILVHSGMSRGRALVMNMATGLTSVLGGVAAYFGLQRALGALPYALALAAAGFLYIAVAGLIPGLHRRADPDASRAGGSHGTGYRNDCRGLRVWTHRISASGLGLRSGRPRTLPPRTLERCAFSPTYPGK